MSNSQNAEAQDQTDHPVRVRSEYRGGVGRELRYSQDAVSKVPMRVVRAAGVSWEDRAQRLDDANWNEDLAGAG